MNNIKNNEEMSTLSISHFTFTFHCSLHYSLTVTYTLHCSVYYWITSLSLSHFIALYINRSHHFHISLLSTLIAHFTFTFHCCQHYSLSSLHFTFTFHYSQYQVFSLMLSKVFIQKGWKYFAKL